MSLHQHSLFANDVGRDSGAFGKRCQDIIALFRRRLLPMTDRQVKEGLSLPDMNNVRPRITELIKAGVLEECGAVRDLMTETMVRQVRLKIGSGYPD